MRKKAVLFDCDGVLVNSEQLVDNYMRIYLGNHDFGYKREEFLELVSGYEQDEATRLIREDFLAQKGYELPADFEAEVWSQIENGPNKHLKAIGGIKHTLDTLKAADIPFAICSNNQKRNIVKHLKQVDLLKYFDDNIFSKEDVTNKKPAPDIYLLGAKKLGVNPKDCFVVEDSQTGVKAGVASGSTVIGFIGERHRHDLRESFLLAEAGATHIAMSGYKLLRHLTNGLGIEEIPCPRHAKLVTKTFPK